MGIELTDDERQMLETEGYSNAEITGGPTRQRYWRPDGKEVFLIPAIRQSAEIRNGKRVPVGSRDANYDRGFLPAAPNPNQLKITCPHCTMWHDTQEEVAQCSENRNNFIVLFENHALDEATKEKEEESIALTEVQKRVDNLESGIYHLEKMLETLINIQVGAVKNG